ncbi:MAG: ABC transporter permease [Candidatus Hadarchaeum sp.]|uniref:ABC transporter permease n=1 Tax=Candidatus Hadarchaeum sp. TaxID=2883567 RepID=UPI003D0ABFB3
MLLGAVFISLSGHDPVAAYAALFMEAFGSVNGITDTLVKAAPLLLAGVGLVVAYKASIWTIGAEGQILIGALAAVWLGLNVKGVPGSLLIPVIMVASFLAGAGLAMIAGVLKAKIGVNEIITTLMLNNIASYFILYLVSGPMKTPEVGYNQTRIITSEAFLPIIIQDTRLHAGVLLAICAAIFVYVLVEKTSLGYKIKAVGHSPKAAKYAGISMSRNILIVMFVSGGLAGLAGMGEVLGVHHLLMLDISPGYGYTAILVALLARLNPIATIASAFLFAGLLNGSVAMQRGAGVPSSLVLIIQALVVIFVLASEYATREKR